MDNEIKEALLQLKEQDRSHEKVVSKIITALEGQNDNIATLMDMVARQQDAIEILNKRLAAIAPFVPKLN